MKSSRTTRTTLISIKISHSTEKKVFVPSASFATSTLSSTISTTPTTKPTTKSETSTTTTLGLTTITVPVLTTTPSIVVKSIDYITEKFHSFTSSFSILITNSTYPISAANTSHEIMAGTPSTSTEQTLSSTTIALSFVTTTLEQMATSENPFEQTIFTTIITTESIPLTKTTKTIATTNSNPNILLITTENSLGSSSTSTKILYKYQYILLYILSCLLFVIVFITIFSAIFCFIYYNRKRRQSSHEYLINVLDSMNTNTNRSVNNDRIQSKNSLNTPTTTLSSLLSKNYSVTNNILKKSSKYNGRTFDDVEF
ncbi:unnamed protein product [Rotaria magnacalcarata]|nr:unnamed protein product [Rotaria magnacalcarata]